MGELSPVSPPASRVVPHTRLPGHHIGQQQSSGPREAKLIFLQAVPRWLHSPTPAHGSSRSIFRGAAMPQERRA